MNYSGTHFCLTPGLSRVLADLGYSDFTPIQKLAIGPLLKGKDLIGQSQTGSGKTAAFAIPLLEKLDTQIRQLQALVLCPTRELSAQVTRELRRLGRYKKDLIVVPLVGGEPFRSQMRSMVHGVQVVVGTPGRILDHLQRKTLALSMLETVVLDEADRMLDMGFREAVETILGFTPSQKQISLFSATFPATIEALSQRVQRTPVRVLAEDEMALPIEEKFLETSRADKLSTLIAFLERNPPESTLLFCNTKLQVDEVYQSLRRRKMVAGKIHGNLEQNDRLRALAKFRNRTTPLLIATDVAARGLDITDVEMIINFDLPSEPEIYVHRIGRTARAGKKGTAISFMTAIEKPKIDRIEAYVKRKLCREVWNPSTPKVPMKGPAMATIFIGGGRKQKTRPTDILGALIGEAGLNAGDVGKIEIHDNFSYVAVQRLHSGRIKGRRFQVELVR